MFLWTIQWIFISILLISLIHYLFLFFENILSVPKMKDLVNIPPKYNHITSNIEPTFIEQKNNIPDSNANAMEIELEDFLQKIQKENHIRNSG